MRGGPPLGTYRCWAGGFDHLPSGAFTLLPGGRYADERASGGGRYLYDPRTQSVEFATGDFEFWEFAAVWQKASQDARGERLVLRHREQTAPIGSERAGYYQYCYREPGPAQTAK